MSKSYPVAQNSEGSQRAPLPTTGDNTGQLNDFCQFLNSLTFRCLAWSRTVSHGKPKLPVAHSILVASDEINVYIKKIKLAKFQALVYVLSSQAVFVSAYDKTVYHENDFVNGRIRGK